LQHGRHDRKILAVVQTAPPVGRRNRQPRRPLVDAVLKRIQRLEADGVITKRVALIGPKIGLGITVLFRSRPTIIRRNGSAASPGGGRDAR
jgi:DNA-binding Lrp family transcriptional regulator